MISESSNVTKTFFGIPAFASAMTWGVVLLISASVKDWQFAGVAYPNIIITIEYAKKYRIILMLHNMRTNPIETNIIDIL